jgi:hypothetical protein
MPMIGRLLQTVTNLRPVPNIHPDEAVARGAALFAEYLLAIREGRKPKWTIELADFTVHSLGIEWVDPASGRAENVVLIPRGTELPAGTVTKVTTTVDDQRSLTIQLLEGESRTADGCARVARVVLSDLPGELPKAWPIDMQLQYAAAGRLQIKATVEQGMHTRAVTVGRECGLSESQVAAWRMMLASEREGLGPILAELAKHAPAAPASAPASTAAGQAPATMAVASAATSAEAPIVREQGSLPEIEKIDLDIDGSHFSSRMRRNRTTGRKVMIMLIGYFVSATLGLAIGYYILMRIDPNFNWFNLPLPGLSRQAEDPDARRAPASRVF